MALAAGAISFIGNTAIAASGSPQLAGGWLPDGGYELDPIVITARDAPNVASAVATAARGAETAARATMAAYSSIISSGVAGASYVMNAVVTSAGSNVGRVIAEGYSTTIGDINTFSTSAHGADLFGADLNVKGKGYYSAVEWQTTSEYSKGTVSLDKLSLSGEIGKAGLSGEIGAEAMSIASDWKVPWAFKDTAFYLHSEAGFGIKFKLNLKVDMAKGSGKVGASFGTGPTGGMELRWKNIKRW